MDGSFYLVQIVVAAEALGAVGGAETYALTVAEHLQRLGHQVWLSGLELGAAAVLASEAGLRVVGPAETTPGRPDAVLSQDAVAALAVAESYPGVPQAFVAHSDVYDKFLPPQVPGVVSAVVAMYDRVERRVRALAVPTEVVRLTQPVDIDRFRPLRSLPERPATALALGHYLQGQRFDLLRSACETAGIELRHIGIHGTAADRPVECLLNDADIVFGKARVIHEAMACGRATYVFDHNGGDGWVTSERYEALVADNFGGQTGAAAIDEQRLAADLAAYDPGMGVTNRDLIVRNHAATKHAAAIVELLRRIAPGPHDPATPLDELARAIRVMHRADAWSALGHRELGLLAERARHHEAMLLIAGEHAGALQRRAEVAEEYARSLEEHRVELERRLAAIEQQGTQ
jgi:hypothetical protein